MVIIREADVQKAREEKSLEWARKGKRRGVLGRKVKQPTFFDEMGLVQQGALTLLLGHPKCGKTFVAADLAARAAKDGVRVEFLALESEGATFRRLQRRVSEMTDPHWVNDNLDFRSLTFQEEGVDLRDHQNAYREWLEMFRRPDRQGTDSHLPEEWADLNRLLPDRQLLLIDAFRNCWPSIDEDNSGDVTTALTPLRDWCADTGNSAIVIQHLGKSGANRGARGSSAFSAIVDNYITIHGKPARDWKLDIVGRDVQQHEFKITLDGAASKVTYDRIEQTELQQERSGEVIAALKRLRDKGYNWSNGPQVDAELGWGGGMRPRRSALLNELARTGVIEDNGKNGPSKAWRIPLPIDQVAFE